MDKRSLMTGAVLGAVLTGLAYAGMAHGQGGGEGAMGAFQATIASSGTGTVLVVLDTRTGRYKYHPLPGNATRTFEFRD